MKVLKTGLLSIFILIHTLPCFGEFLAETFEVVRQDTTWKYTLNYNPQQNITLKQISYYDAVQDTFMAYQYTEYFYLNNILSKTVQHTTVDNTWMTSHTTTYTYTTRTTQKDEVTPSWQASQRDTYNTLQERLTSEFSSTKTGTLITSKNSYTYNANHQVVLFTQQKNDTNCFQLVNSYTEDLLSVSTLMTYNSFTKTWMPYSKTNYYYSPSGQLIEELQSYYSEDHWVNRNKTLYTYNQNTLVSTQYWHWNTEFWSPDHKIDYTDTQNYSYAYFENNFWHENYLIHSTDQTTFTLENTPLFWAKEPAFSDIFLPLFEKSFNYIYGHKIKAVTVNTTGHTFPESQSLTVYPNPSRDGLFYLASTIVYDYKVYTPSGLCLLSSKKKDTRVLNLSALPAGLYLVMVHSSQGTRTLKLIKTL